MHPALQQMLFSLLPHSGEAWSDFSAIFTESHLRRGDYFALEGRVEMRFGFLLQGVMRAFYRNQEGVEYNKTFFTAHDFFGAYASLVTGKPNRIHVQALTDCTLLSASYRDLTALFPRHRSLETLARLIAERFYIEKEQREIELVLLQADERYRIFRDNYPGLENDIPQYHIASYLGITPTQLSRIRARFRKPPQSLPM